MGGLFMGGLAAGEFFEGTSGGASASGVDAGANFKMRDLEHHVQRLSLQNQALWEVLQKHLNIPEEELEAKIKEIDLRDGVEDGKVTDVALQCPKCGRVSSRKHWKCLYCGAKFKKPVMG